MWRSSVHAHRPAQPAFLDSGRATKAAVIRLTCACYRAIFGGCGHAGPAFAFTLARIGTRLARVLVGRDALPALQFADLLHAAAAGQANRGGGVLGAAASTYMPIPTTGRPGRSSVSCKGPQRVSAAVQCTGNWTTLSDEPSLIGTERCRPYGSAIWRCWKTT